MPIKIKKSGAHFFSRGGGRSIAVVIIGAIILGIVLFKTVTLKTVDPNAINKQQIGNAVTGILSQEEINRLPDTFYREDIPRDILEKFPKDIIDRLPSRSKSMPSR